MEAIEAPGVKISATPFSFSVAMSAGGTMPPPNTMTSSRPRLCSSSTTRGNSVRWGAGQDGEPDGVGVLLQCGLGHLFGRLEQPRVDHLETGVAQGAGDHLDPPIVSIEAGLGHDDSIRTLHAGHPKRG